MLSGGPLQHLSLIPSSSAGAKNSLVESQGNKCLPPDPTARVTACPKSGMVLGEGACFTSRCIKSSYELGLLYQSISSAVFAEENDWLLDLRINMLDYEHGL